MSRWRPRWLLAAALLLAQPAAAAPTWSIPWWTIDGGGVLSAQAADWRLSGTIGQWDAAVEAPLSAGEWTLSGGFWTAGAADGERLFADGFEGG